MRAALTVATLGLTTAVSYVLQRLLATVDPLPESAVVAQEHVPFFWRCGLALFHGVLLAAIVGLGVRDPAPALRVGYRLVLVLLPLLVIATLLVP